MVICFLCIRNKKYKIFWWYDVTKSTPLCFAHIPWLVVLYRFKNLFYTLHFKMSLYFLVSWKPNCMLNVTQLMKIGYLRNRSSVSISVNHESTAIVERKCTQVDSVSFNQSLNRPHVWNKKRPETRAMSRRNSSVRYCTIYRMTAGENAPLKVFHVNDRTTNMIASYVHRDIGAS